MFYIQQISNHDCGFTCLKIMLANLFKDENYLYLSSPFKEDKDVSLKELNEYAKKLGVSLNVLKSLEKDRLYLYDKLPLIAIIKEEETYHAVYLYKVNKKKVYYYDPSFGFNKKDYDEFISIWTGNFIISEQKEKVECPIKKPHLINIKERMISFLLTLISAVSTFLGVYYINKNSYFIIPAIFFSLMIIFELILKRFNILLMERMDERIKEYYLDIKNKEYFSFHILFSKYKEKEILNNVSFFSSAFIVIIISLILILNDYMNLIYIGINVLLSLFYVFIIIPHFDKKEVEIEKEESLLAGDKDQIDAFMHIRMINEKSYQYGNSFNAYKYVVIFLEILTAFIMMMVNNVVNVSYIICYFVLELYFYQNLNQYLSSPYQNHKKNNLLMKIISLLEKE